jgi:magnesium-protoporphyrin IX monomethyl ester (oxidative) cyclase
MKILLILPVPPRTHFPRGVFFSKWVPSGIGYIATALLRAGCEVRVHIREEQLVKNGFNWDHADELLRAELKSFAPDVVGLSVFTPSMREACTIAEMAKRICGDSTLVVAGGPHPTALPERTLKEGPAIDAVVVGEGERTMVELAAKGPGQDVAGVVWRDGNGGFLRSPARALEHDLDALGAPAYSLFDMKYWTAPGRFLVRWLPMAATNVNATRGCMNRCQFCAGHVVAGLGARFRSVDGVVEQLERVVKDYGLEGFRFEDDSLGADPDYLRRLCEALHRRGMNRLRWDCCMRVDQITPALLEDLRAAGCIQVEYGFESGSDAMLRRLGKNATVARNREVVGMMRQAGLRIFANIMIGLPGETLADIRATEEFVYWAKPEVLSYGCLMPLPGTPLFDRLPESVQASVDWADYTYATKPGLGFNLTAMTDGELAKAFRHFDRHLAAPQIALALRRDALPSEQRQRKYWMRKFVGFAVRHPYRASRLLF